MYWVKQYFSNAKLHLAAASEVVFTSAVSLMPFLITFFVQSSDRQDGSFIPITALFGRGQLYLVSLSVFSNVFWMAFLNGDKPRHGARVFLGAISLIMILPVYGFLGKDATFSSILNQRIVYGGYFEYSFILFINYLILFYMNIPPPEPSDVFTREAADMRSQYEGSKPRGN